MQSCPRTSSVAAAVAAAIVVGTSIAPPPVFAQSAPTAPPAETSAAPPERFGIGVAVGGGPAGTVSLVRASAPVTAKVGFDVEGGRLHRNARLYLAQVRYFFHERRAEGTSDYLIAGAALVKQSTRTEIRWPNGRVDVIIGRERCVVPQVGYGRDLLYRHGVRVGIDVTGGATEKTGPLVMFRAFLVWGPALP
jgi:hypothetical protein